MKKKKGMPKVEKVSSKATNTTTKVGCNLLA
jgi:hypothetical protein